jgi:HEAT repeat protein
MKKKQQRIEDLIASLKTQDPATRRGANVSLCDPGVSDAFVPALLAAAADADDYIRESAIHALGRYDVTAHPLALDAILHALAHDPAEAVRAAAATMLERQPADCVPALVDALADPSPTVREQATWALGAFRGNRRALTALKDRLHHDDHADVRSMAATELGGMKNPGLLPALLAAAGDKSPEVRACVIRALRDCADFKKPPALHEVFIAGLTDSSALVRTRAAEALKYWLPSAAPALMRALRDPHAPVRQEAVEALGSLRLPATIKTIAERLFDDEDEETRSQAASALGHMRHERATAHLVKAFGNTAEARSVRWSILWALGDSDDQQAVPVLCAALADPDAEFRERAAGSLGRLYWEEGTDTMLPLQALCAALRDAEADVRRSACQALGRLRDARAAPFLAEALRDRDANVRAEALEALGEFEGEDHQPAILACLRDPDPRVSRTAAGSLRFPAGAQTPPEVLACLGSPKVHPHIKGRLAQALARHQDPAVVPHLIEALAVEDAAARASIVEALREQPDQRALKPLLALLDDADEQVRAEAALAVAALRNDKAIAPLKARLRREPLPYVRRRIVWALSFFTPEKVMPLLTASLADDDPHVREQAAQALAEAEADLAHDGPDGSPRFRLVGLGTLHYE